MTDQNLEVRKVCERGLMLIAESDTKWEERIKNERFCWHNAQWLEAIAKTNLLSSPGNNIILTSTQWTNRTQIQTFIVYTGPEDEQSIAGSVLDLCVRHADLLDRASNSASSFGSPESRIGSPVESIDAWDTQI